MANNYSTMPKEDLLMELTILREEYQWFQMAERNYHSHREESERRECIYKLNLIGRELKRRAEIREHAINKLKMEKN